VKSALTAYHNEMVPYAFKAVDNAAKMMGRLADAGSLQRWLLLRLLPRLHKITVPEGNEQHQA
jgi:hypothetical protein